MKKMFRDLSLSIAMALGAVALLIGAVALMVHVVPITAQAGLMEQPSETEVKFDTSALQTWCHGDDIGTIRMVEACPVKHSAGGYWTVEDGYGELWMLEGIGLHHDDFLMLWIADSNTPDNVMDDVIVKVWVEAH